MILCIKGHLIPYNESSGVLPLDSLLLLKNVSRSLEGQYSCAATNTEGENYSESFALDVQCKYNPNFSIPVCYTYELNFHFLNKNIPA